MSHTNVKSDWLNGNQNFKDKSGNIIATFDGENRKLSLPTGSTLDATDMNTWLNAVRAFIADGMLTIATITVSGVSALKFKTTTTTAFRLSGIVYTKVAEDEIVFTTAGTINVAGAAGTAHWGAWLVQTTAAGVVTTKAVGGGTTDQDYATEALAIAALPAATAANCPLGYITVQGLASTSWVAATSNLTVGAGAGNCTARNFYDLPTPPTLPAAL
jgi:hypothetical protein